jgi:DNA-nicking Smr family endonuclease
MAKKKKTQSPPKPDTFRSTPFSTLKGVAVSAPPPAPGPARPVPSPAPAIDDDRDLFLQAMDDVKRLDATQAAQNKMLQAGMARVVPQPAAERKAEVDRFERETFTQAIGQLKLDVTFTDRIHEDEELKPMGGNRLRQLKRGVISVERQLDLHGLNREEALAALPRFLQSAIDHGEMAALVITGKGLNSPGEPVLQQAVAGWLRETGKKLVVEFAPAPREMGGSGAFVVFLRTGDYAAP